MVRREGLDDSWVTEYTNVQFGAQPVDLFGIPRGYEGTRFSQDWEGAIGSLFFMGAGSVDEAKKAGLRVEIENESNGDDS